MISKKNLQFDGLAHYFSKLDIEGIKNILSNDCRHGGYPKAVYLEMIEEAFDYLKSKGISSLQANSGVCTGCLKGCKGLIIKLMLFYHYVFLLQ